MKKLKVTYLDVLEKMVRLPLTLNMHIKIIKIINAESHTLGRPMTNECETTCGANPESHDNIGHSGTSAC